MDTPPKRKRGNQPLDPDGVELLRAKVPISMYERVAAYAARRHRGNMSGAIRELVERGLRR